MAITRKPAASSAKTEVDIEALIRKGGSVTGEAKTVGQTKTSAVVLRIPSDLLLRIDQAVQSRPVKIPRHTWLLEAVVEKLENESK